MTPEEEATRRRAEALAMARELAASIIKETRLGFDPATIRKGIVTAVSATTTPPTISVQISGDTTTTVTGVRFEDTFTPRVGATVLLTKQANQLLASGHVADQVGAAGGGWTQASLATGWTHNGNSNGNVMFRRVMDNGSWKMQWQGGAVPSGTTVLAANLGTDFRPASLRTVSVARNIGGGATTCHLDFHPDGSIILVGGTTAPSPTGSNGPGATNSNSSTTTFDDPNDETTTVSSHLHGVVGGHSHGGGAHTHGINNHTHVITVDSPLWISFNKVEYFL